MSRHKNLKSIVADSYYDEDYYNDYGAEYGNEGGAYGSEDEHKEEQKQIQKAKKKSKKQNLVDDKVVQEIFDQFNKFFTQEQVKQTLIANYNDKLKTIADLRFKEDKLKQKGKENLKQVIQVKKQKVEEEKKQFHAEEEEFKQYEVQLLKKEKSLNAEIEIDHKTLNQIYPEVTYADPEFLKHLEEDNKTINLVIIGHVDSGKSTLTGHLLYKLGKVDRQTMHKMEKISDQYGKSSFKFAYLLDEGEEERRRGVTIQVGQSYFATENKDFVILDAPGHQDFVPNMISGASQADCAILV